MDTLEGWFPKICVFICICFITGLSTAILLRTKTDYWLPPRPLPGNATYIDPKKKIILWWREPWDPYHGFDMEMCTFSNCIMTLDRFYYQQSDAVMFSGFQFLERTEKDMPKTRPRNQYWIYQNMESQQRSLTDDSVKFLNGKINLTITFLPNSDIFSPYGILEKIRTVEQDIVYNKTMLVAWVVSYCVTPSKREVYFKELQKHIQADMFGNCNPVAKCEGNCFEYISRNYKFYFAAENSLCKEYITEKVYRNSMKYSMIPIVYGGANYSKHLPTRSYIDVRDFRTPEKLAAYLKILDQNDTLYNEYFKWKEKFRVKDFSGAAIGFCNLCQFLNTKQQIKTKPHMDLHEIWTKKDCISSDDYLKNIM